MPQVKSEIAIFGSVTQLVPSSTKAHVLPTITANVMSTNPRLYGSGVRAHYIGRDRGQHVGFCRTGDELGHGAEDRDFALHLGHLSGDGFSTCFRRLARTKSRGAGHHGARLLGSYLGGPCAVTKLSLI